MSVFVAKLFVPVALIAAAAPAFASTSPSQVSIATSETALNQDSAKSVGGLYWTGSSEYYVTPTGATTVSANGRGLRRVLITGYHPVDGFETEVAREAAEAARH